MKDKRGWKSGVIVLMLLVLAAAPWAGAFTLEEVRIEREGQAPLDESFVRAYTSLRSGQPVESEEELNAAVARDVDNLRRSGRFSLVRAFVEQDGDVFRLVYRVTARQRIHRIEIAGAERVSNRRIRRELDLNPGDFADEALIGEKARQLEAFLRKNHHPDAEVRWTVAQDERSDAINVRFDVREGARVRVRRVQFEGDRFKSEAPAARTGRFFKRLVPRVITRQRDPQEEFEQREVRRAVEQKTTWRLAPWWGGLYRPELVPQDRASVREFYRDRGFLDVEVGEPAVRPVRRGRIEMTYPVEEGRLYRIGQIDHEGITLFEAGEVMRMVTLLPGQVASQARIDEAAGAMNRFYGNRGYIRNRVEPVITTDPETGLADVLFRVNEGTQATIHQIHIRGNEKTRDEVMRRELAVFPGEKFHQQKVETSEARLRNLDYFKRVGSTYDPVEDREDAYDLTFNVVEKPMGSFIIGAGISSVDNIVAFGELSHGNVDIRRWPPVGAGQKLRLRVQAGTERSDAEVSFVEPWFLNRRLALGVDLYHRNAAYYSDQYDLQNTGGRLSLTRPLGPFVRGTIRYTLEEFRVHDVTAPVGSSIWNERGNRFKSAAGVVVSRDTRDRGYIPTRGNRSSISFEFAGGPLGGDTDIYSLNLRSSQFFPLPGGHVFNLRGEVATVDAHSGRVPIFDRLFLGGPRDIRAFAFRDVSPRDPLNRNEPDGGLSSWFVTAEYTVPLWEKVRGAVFYDIGEVSANSFDWMGSDINSGYGIGIRLDLPMFPLQLDYAIPHLTDSFNQGASPRWSFSLGYTF